MTKEGGHPTSHANNAWPFYVLIAHLM